VNAPPQSICILRLSALGDATHVLPLVHTLRDAWPGVALTWIIGRLEARLVGDLPGVEFVVVDKAQGLGARRALRASLRGRRFDALLHCQVALRANWLATAVRAVRRIGFDRARSKDLHGLVLTERIPARTGQHVLDAIGSFAEPLGVRPAAVRWDIPIPDEAHAFAASWLPGEQPTLLLSPCSSHALRNWRPERYAAVADHVVARHGWRVLLCGGRSPDERAMGDAIIANMRNPPIDLIGQDTLKQFLALARRATAVLTPDAGPMHMANAVGTPVIGLHAASNPARSGPYSSRQWCIDRYDAAARRFRGVPASELRWGTKLEYPGVMDLVEADAVIETLDRFVRASQAATQAACRLPDVDIDPDFVVPRR
jgi:heptosyltransferase I